MPADTQATITVQEQGKLAQKCKILKTWKTPEGSTAYQVRALDTGEIMTIVESGPVTKLSEFGPGSRIQAMATRIFHWGRGQTPPPGTPIAPSEYVQSTPMPVAPQVVQAPPVVPATPAMPAKPVVTPVVTAAQPATPPPPKVDQAATAAPTPKPPEAPKTTSTSALSDWRKSWGKANDFKSTESSTPTAQTTSKQDKKEPAALPHADMTAPDPLKSPEKYARITLETKKDSTTAANADKAKTGMSPAKPTAYSKSDMAGDQKTKISSAMQPSTETTTMAVPQLQYIAVPIVTVPDFRRLPSPPPGPPQVVPPSLAARNAAAASQGAVSRPFGPGPTTSDPGVTNAFMSPPSEEAVARVTNAFGPMDANEEPQMGPGVANNSRQALMARNAAGSQAPAHVPMNLPAPAVMRAGFEGAPASAGSADATTKTIPQMMSALHDSLLPSQREWALEGLAKTDWRSNPAIVKAILQAAKDDPAATVRAGCVRCLAKMKASTEEVVQGVQGLKYDSDPRVRHEFEEAMHVLAPSTMSMDRQGLQPASAIVPGK